MSPDQTDSNREKSKVGVYICHCGGNISDHVDVEELKRSVADMDGVEMVHTNTFMCSDPGQELIQEDIRSGKVNRVVVASCAPSLHETTFRAAIKRADMNPYLYEHANIREQVSWVHHGKPATEKAAKLVSAAVAKAAKLEALEPVRVDAANHATVIGAGMAGMRAALDMARRGINVTLLEKTDYLGGQTARLDKVYPTEEAAGALVEAMARAVMEHPNIELLTRTEVVGFEGYVGNFKLTLKTLPHSSGDGSFVPFQGVFPPETGDGEGSRVLETGVVVMATGFKTYEPAEGEYGYLAHREVLTLPSFIEAMANGSSQGGMLTLGGRKVRRIAFIHCVGSRQIPGIHEPGPDGVLNEYCSRTCCGTILRTALEIRQSFPKTMVLDYYRDIRTYGRGQEAYYEKASENNVLFFRFEPDAPPLVERASGGKYPLRIRVNDTLTFGEELTAEVDLVVLAVGMEARPIRDLVEMMKLPTGMDRFLQEVHPKLRPVEVAANGILLAGTCQAPMDITESCAAAQASAAKAATLLAKGYVELDPYVARVDSSLCNGSGKCTAVCPVEGAIYLFNPSGGEAERAEVNPALCTGCGICVAECPNQAINVKGWSLEQYERMVEAILAA